MEHGTETKGANKHIHTQRNIVYFYCARGEQATQRWKMKGKAERTTKKKRKEKRMIILVINKNEWIVLWRENNKSPQIVDVFFSVKIPYISVLID